MGTPFQSTPSVWRETWNFIIHRSRCSFQSTPSVWRETGDMKTHMTSCVFQSTPSVWRETNSLEHLTAAQLISIHSLRMEGDKSVPFPGVRECGISIHSLRMEGDSTDPPTPISLEISIHSLRMEGDQNYTLKTKSRLDFNPLPPYGGRRSACEHDCTDYHISIHSLRMEGDFFCVVSGQNAERFQSTPSVWRETVPEMMILSNSLTFQSTPSVWRETCVYKPLPDLARHFNPLPPYGGRPTFLVFRPVRQFISIHSLRMEGDNVTSDFWRC